MAKVLAVNAGSSSLKFKLFEMPEEKVICSGLAERIGHEDGIFTIKYDDKKDSITTPILNHVTAVNLLLNALIEKGIIKDLKEIKSIGHRVVQGGNYFNKSAQFNAEVEAKIEELIPLAPLHNSANLVGYRAFREVLPEVPAVAVFDTAFHQTMEEEDYLFPIPFELAEKYSCRRYGAHGTSHKYLSEVAIEKVLNGAQNSKIICCHLGSGASISAIKNGKCVATSMGLTPLGGIMMGTRTGDLDPSVMNYLCKCTGKTYEEMYNIFNKQSGFKGVSGVSDDSRDILDGAANGNKRCVTANRLFIRRICDYIGQYFVRLGGADLIIFSAGIGENADYYRTEICKELNPSLGVEIDESINKGLRGKLAVLSTPTSKIKVALIPTDEEVMIARDAYEVIK